MARFVLQLLHFDAVGPAGVTGVVLQSPQLSYFGRHRTSRRDRRRTLEPAGPTAPMAHSA
eukprot:11007079-Karenia_brevis.AAC.1